MSADFRHNQFRLLVYEWLRGGVCGGWGGCRRGGLRRRWVSRGRSRRCGRAGRAGRRGLTRRVAGSKVVKGGQRASCASSTVLKSPAARKAKMTEPRRGDVAVGDEHGLAEDVGVDLVERGVALGDAAAVDDAADGGAVLLHAVEDDAGVHGGAFDGGEELVRGGVGEVPAEGDAAERGVDEHGAVAVVPGEAQQAGLAGFEVGGGFGELGDGGAARARRWRRRRRRPRTCRLRCRPGPGRPSRGRRRRRRGPASACR